jgi:hypothetical protein
MGFYASFSGARVVSGRVTIPYYGAPVADVVLADASNVDTFSQLIIGDLTLTCYLFRTAVFAGLRECRLVGGYGGWTQQVGAKYYQSDVGVSASVVLRDVAREVGEKVQLASDSTLGTSFVRQAAQAQRVLRQVGGRLWWVDTSGVTQVGTARDGSAITSAFTSVLFHGGQGLASVAAEVISDWTPGRTFSSPTITTPQTISATTIDLKDSGTARLGVLTV